MLAESQLDGSGTVMERGLMSLFPATGCCPPGAESGMPRHAVPPWHLTLGTWETMTFVYVSILMFIPKWGKCVEKKETPALCQWKWRQAYYDLETK